MSVAAAIAQCEQALEFATNQKDLARQALDLAVTEDQIIGSTWVLLLATKAQHDATETLRLLKEV